MGDDGLMGYGHSFSYNPALMADDGLSTYEVELTIQEVAIRKLPRGN